MLGSVSVLLLLSTCLAASYEHNEAYGNDRNNQGLKKLDIIGGKNTTIEKHPYQVSITFSDGSFIAGAILNKKWIITTAANLNKFSNEDLSVRVGSNRTESGGTLYKVAKTVIHPNYDANYEYYNVALVKLSKPLTFGKTVKSVNLPKKELKAGQKVVVSGWGETSSLQGNPFKEITLKLVSYKDCASAYYSLISYSVSKSQACAIADNYQNGPFYDFGAPIVSKNTVYGGYSFRYIYQGIPAIFSNTFYVLKWISKTIKS